MPVKKVKQRNKASNGWDDILYASSADIVQRAAGTTTVEDSLLSLEANYKTLNGKVAVKSYSSLTAINSGYTNATTMDKVCNSMASPSIAVYRNTTNAAGSVYPTNNGTVYIVKSANNGCFAFYMDAKTNSLYTGVYNSGGSPVWSGWTSYKLTVDTSIKSGSRNPVSGGAVYTALRSKVNIVDSSTQPAASAQNTNDIWLKPI